jgi:cell wall assembly regulator SMI1
MNVTLNIDPTQLTGELQEFISKLTDQDKKDLVTAVVKDYYSEFAKFDEREKQLLDRQAIEYARKEGGTYYANDLKTDEGARRNHYYRQFMDRHVSLAELTRREISSAIKSELKTQVDSFIKTDPACQAMITQAMEDVKNNFPALLQAALVQHMANQMSSVAHTLSAFGQQVDNKLQYLQGQINRT